MKKSPQVDESGVVTYENVMYRVVVSDGNARDVVRVSDGMSIATVKGRRGERTFVGGAGGSSCVQDAEKIVDAWEAAGVVPTQTVSK